MFKLRYFIYFNIGGKYAVIIGEVFWFVRGLIFGSISCIFYIFIFF